MSEITNELAMFNYKGQSYYVLLRRISEVETFEHQTWADFEDGIKCHWNGFYAVWDIHNATEKQKRQWIEKDRCMTQSDFEEALNG